MRAASENQIVVASQLRPGPGRQSIVCRVGFEVLSQRARADKGGAGMVGQEATSRQCRARFSAAPFHISLASACFSACQRLPLPVSGREKSGVAFAVTTRATVLLFWGLHGTISQYRLCRFGSPGKSNIEARCGTIIAVALGIGYGPVKLVSEITGSTALGLSAWPCKAAQTGQTGGQAPREERLHGHIRPQKETSLPF